MKFVEIFKDVVELAKAGYSPKDVKDLLEFCNTDPTAKDTDLSDKVEQIKEEKKEEKEESVINAFKKLVEDEQEETE